MKTLYIGVDLGSTNLKAALYDRELKLLDSRSCPVSYLRQGNRVEFDALRYCEELVELLRQLMTGQTGVLREISFTGQAESLVVLGEDGLPLMNAISWMDERSVEECALLAEKFSPRQVAAITGQMAVVPTWPATKILWLQKNCPDIFRRAATYMMLKDYVVYYLTGKKLADMSIATFTLYFDIYHKCYWQEMLDAIGISSRQLPPLTEPCSQAGSLLPQLAEKIGADATVNVGTLDHFAGMIGTGNLTPGGITLSMGTVMALATMVGSAAEVPSLVAAHYGFLPDTYVLLPVAESGGVSLEWFRRTCMPQVDYGRLNRELEQRSDCGQLLFLPYLVGTNAPEFDAEASGVFWGLRQEHDSFDMARAVMEGVAFLLRKNCQSLARSGLPCRNILAVGGGTKSPLWCQLWADITGIPVHIPQEQEAACLGAAILAAVDDGAYADFAAAAAQCVRLQAVYTPRPSAALEAKYRRFCKLYEAALAVSKDA